MGSLWSQGLRKSYGKGDRVALIPWAPGPHSMAAAPEVHHWLSIPRLHPRNKVAVVRVDNVTLHAAR